MEVPSLGSGGPVTDAALLVLGGFVTYLGTALVRRQSEKKELLGRVTDMESELKILKSNIQPISMAFQQILIKELTHFHEQRTDELLAKIGPPYMLNEVEEKELVTALNKRIDESGDLMTESEIDAAKMLPMLIKRVKVEAAIGIVDLKVVAVPAAGSNGAIG